MEIVVDRNCSIMSAAPFQAFAPTKSGNLDPVVGSFQPSESSNTKIADLFAQFKKNRNAFAVKDVITTSATETGVNLNGQDDAKVARKNVPTFSRCLVGTGLISPKLIHKLEVEANFDITSIVISKDLVQKSRAFDATAHCLRKSSHIKQKLSEWMESQQSWMYPDGPVTAASLKLSRSSAELALTNYWDEPSNQDLSNDSVVKRRKLKWQTALLSAMDELLLQPVHPDNDAVGKAEKSQLSTGENNMDSFYILGSDSEISEDVADIAGDGFGMQQTAKSLPLSALFFRTKREKVSRPVGIPTSSSRCLKKDEGEAILSEEEIYLAEEDVSCILTGAKKSFTDRLIELGAKPMEMVLKKDMQRMESAIMRNKKANKNISSAGRLEVSHRHSHILNTPLRNTIVVGVKVAPNMPLGGMVSYIILCIIVFIILSSFYSLD